jgi:hypothetical protein
VEGLLLEILAEELLGVLVVELVAEELVVEDPPLAEELEDLSKLPSTRVRFFKLIRLAKLNSNLLLLQQPPTSRIFTRN